MMLGMFDFNGNGCLEPEEEYLAFRVWEEMCGITEDDDGEDDDSEDSE